MDDDDKRQTSPAFSDSDVGHLWPGTMHNANEDVTHIFRGFNLFAWHKVPKKHPETVPYPSKRHMFLARRLHREYLGLGSRKDFSKNIPTCASLSNQ